MWITSAVPVSLIRASTMHHVLIRRLATTVLVSSATLEVDVRMSAVMLSCVRTEESVLKTVFRGLVLVLHSSLVCML